MQKKEWVISICMLCVLALAAAGLSTFVLQKNRPENVAAFENRFLDLADLSIKADEEMRFEIDGLKLKAAWQDAADELVLETAVQTLSQPCKEWQLELGGGGLQNARQEERWGYQVWLEMNMLQNGEIIQTKRAELPLESDNPDRTRIYTVRADAVSADSWKLRVIITPVDGEVSEGSLILKNWEVHAR